MAYENYLRSHALEEFRIRRLEYAMLAPWGGKKLKPPKKPAILRED